MNRLKRLRDLEATATASQPLPIITNDMTPTQAGRIYAEFVRGSRQHHRHDVSPAEAKALADAYAQTLNDTE